MPGLQQLVAFAETAKHGGFAAAARESGVAPSTLAKAVARLEHELGVRLFHRTTREVRLSPDGERLFRRCQRVLAELEDLRAEAASSRAAPAGTLRLSLPVHYGKRFVLPRLIALQQRHPGLRLDVRLSDSWEDLVRDGIDLAVRIGALADSSLVARRIDQQHLVLCASPAYLARRGTPKRIDELAGHEAVTFRLPASGRPDNMVEDEFADGTLVELLPSCRPEPLPIQLVHPPGRLLPARVRAAIDALDLLGLRRRAQ